MGCAPTHLSPSEPQTAEWGGRHRKDHCCRLTAVSAPPPASSSRSVPGLMVRPGINENCDQEYDNIAQNFEQHHNDQFNPPSGMEFPVPPLKPKPEFLVSSGVSRPPPASSLQFLFPQKSFQRAREAFYYILMLITSALLKSSSQPRFTSLLKL